MNIVSIEIPNLLKSPYIIQPVLLNNQTYFFQYFWNLRQSRAYLSIYKKNNNDLEYLIKNLCLIPQIELSKYIRQPNWKGSLGFGSIIGGQELDYRQDNIHTEFQIVYSSES